ncbi:MAG: DUF2809 domain-containing protein [Sphingobacteriales bacterium]
MKFNKYYFLLAVLLFAIELYIGLYVHDAIIRPFGGDFLVAIFLYCVVKSFINTPLLLTSGLVLLFTYAVEISQYFHLVNRLGLEHSKTAKILLGTTFSFIDLGTYTLGILLVIIAENIKFSLKKF